MEVSIKNSYELCQECEFADFKDFDNMKCMKAVPYHLNETCSSYKKIELENNQNLIASGRFNNIVDEMHQNAVDQIKDKKSEVVLIESKIDFENTRDDVDYRINTLQEVTVYDSTDIIFGRKLRTIPKNKLVPFHRDVIRDGIDMILLKEPDGSKAYIEKDLKKLFICNQCKVKDKPLDILLMSHDDYDNYVVSDKPEARVIKTGFEKHLNSYITVDNGNTYVQIKDEYKKDDRTISTINLIAFKSPMPDLKIGRLAPDSKFYITSSDGDKKARKIKTDDGKEGILLSSTETYKLILPAVEQIVNFIVIVLTLAIVIGIIVSVLEATGWLIIIGIAVIIIAYLVAILIGAPIYLILNQIIKRL